MSPIQLFFKKKEDGDISSLDIPKDLEGVSTILTDLPIMASQLKHPSGALMLWARLLDFKELSSNPTIPFSTPENTARGDGCCFVP